MVIFLMVFHILFALGSVLLFFMIPVGVQVTHCWIPICLCVVFVYSMVMLVSKNGPRALFKQKESYDKIFLVMAVLVFTPIGMMQYLGEQKYLELSRNHQVAIGKIVEINLHSAKYGRKYYTVSVAFTDLNDKEYTTGGSFSAREASCMHLQDTMLVVYNPRYPEIALLKEDLEQ